MVEREIFAWLMASSLLDGGEDPEELEEGFCRREK